MLPSLLASAATASSQPSQLNAVTLLVALAIVIMAYSLGQLVLLIAAAYFKKRAARSPRLGDRDSDGIPDEDDLV